MKKKFFHSLLAVLLLCLMLVPCALAEELMIGEGQLELYSEGAFPDPPMLRQARFAARTKTVEQTIIEGLMAEEAEINIYDYQLKPDDLYVVLQDLINNEPDLFFVSGGYKYSQYPDDPYVFALVPTYLYTGAELKAEIAAYNRAVDAIVADARKADNVVGQLLRANEYFCLNFEYDTDLVIRKPNEFFKYGKGVCQAYTLAFKAVCDRLGVTSTAAPSSAMNHIWNMVNVGGEWYHIDVTWNDPTPDSKLFAHHKNFMRSDSGISSTGHHSWSSSVSATSTKYDSVGWLELGVPLSVIGDTVYYTSIDDFNVTVHTCDISDLSVTDLYTYRISSYSSWGVPCCSNGYRVYFPKGDSVYSVDMDGADYRLEYTLGDGRNIRSMVIKENQLTMIAAGDSSSEMITVSVKYPLTMTIVPVVMAMQPGETLQLVVAIDPEPAEMPTMTYVSSQPLVVSFDENGMMTAGLPGTATVTAKISDTVFAEASVNVHTANAAVLPANTTTIGSEAFKSMPTVEFILPEGVETIGSGAFAGCDDLLYINLPDSLTKIEADAFDADSKVTLVVTNGTYAHEFAAASGLNTAVLNAETAQTQESGETVTE